MMRKKQKKTEQSPQIRSRRRRLAANGTYAAAMTAILVAAVVVVNFIVAALPSKFTVFDVTASKLYSVGKTTKSLLDSLSGDVTLNLITQTGQEDQTIVKLLENYAGESKHVTFREIDSVSDPTFVKKYTDSSVTLNSVIVVSGNRSKVVDYNDMYAYSDYYSQSADSFDGEGKITSAIAYVTGGSGAKVYYTTGHKELELGSEMKDAFGKANVETASLNLLSSEIPDDCTALISFCPQQDYTADEVKKVTDYLADGGHALLVTAPTLWTGASTPKFDSIVAAYGLSRSGGAVLEGDQSHYTQIPYLLVPNVSASSEVTKNLTNENIMVGMSDGIQIGESEDASYTVTPLLTTSDSAYLKTDLSSTYEKESGDASGEYTLGVAVEQTYSNDDKGKSDMDASASGTESAASSSVKTDVSADAAGSGAVTTVSGAETPADHGSGSVKNETAKEMKLLYFTTPTTFSAEALSLLIQQQADLPTGNDDLFASIVTYLTDQKVTVSVAAKSTSAPQTTINSGAVSMLGNLFMILLPAAVLIAGFAVWGRRRKR